MSIVLKRSFVALVDIPDFNLKAGDEFTKAINYDYLTIAKDNYVNKYSKLEFDKKYKEGEHYQDIQNY